MNKLIFIGWDEMEASANEVAERSLFDTLSERIAVKHLLLRNLTKKGIYTRPTFRQIRNGRLQTIDHLSATGDYDGAMSTDHACSRFWVPELAGFEGLALFMDGDMLVRKDISEVFDGLDMSKAVHVVKHRYEPEHTTKKGGAQQTRYACKNWSSFCIFNCEHPLNQDSLVLIRDKVPGRDLHAFCWLPPEAIGELDPKWNWLVGHSDPAIDPAVVHYTEGIPLVAGHENDPYADEWRSVYVRCLSDQSQPIGFDQNV